MEDIAIQAVELGRQRNNNVADTAGPEVYTYKDFVQLIAGELRPRLAPLIPRLAGFMVNDVVRTKQEMAELMSRLLTSAAPTKGKTNFRNESPLPLMHRGHF